MPREHGAYAALGFPVVTALVHCRLVAAAWLIAAAAGVVFVAHESLLVILGSRGARVRKEYGRRARIQLSSLSLVALALALTALWRMPTAGLMEAFAVALLPAVLALFIVVKEHEKTLGGELVAGLSMSAAAIPIAVAGGIDLAVAATLAGLWWAVFALGTLSVRSVTRRRQAEGRLLAWLTPTLGICLLAACSGAALLAELPWWVVRALAPAGLAVLCLALISVQPAQLRKIGWGLVGVSVLTFVLLLPPLTQLG